MDMDLTSAAVEVINDLSLDTLTFLIVIRANPVKHHSPPFTPTSR
jgi:hypothetical protein